MLCGLPDLTALERDVKGINESYLMLCRELARQDKVLAAQKFGVSATFVDRIARATSEDIRQLAASPSFLFQPRSGLALEIVLGAILAPDVQAGQIDVIRNASMLADGRLKECAA